MRKKNIVVAASVILSFLLSSCTQADTDISIEHSTEVSTELEKKDELLLDWYINFSWYTTQWGDSVVSKTITETTGVDINFVAPFGTENVKFDALMASDNLPDLITLEWWEPRVDELIESEMVYSLTELAEEYEPLFFEYANETILEWNQKSDGEVYYYPNSYAVPSDYENDPTIASNRSFLVREDIYLALGSPDMTSPEGFMQAIRDAAELFPMVGEDPLIPFGTTEFTEIGSSSFDSFLMEFLAIPYEKEGEYYDRYQDLEYIEWLKVFRQLEEEGYLSLDIFLDQRKQMEEKVAEGRYFCMLYQYSDIEAQQNQLIKKSPEQKYIAIDGPKNSNGDPHELLGAGINGWTVTLVSKNCEDPEKAIEFLTYLLSEEGQKIAYLGVKGEMYYEDNGSIALDPYVETLLTTDRTLYDKVYGGNNTYWMLQNNVLQQQWKNQVIEPSQAVNWALPYTKYLDQYIFHFDSKSEIGEIERNLELLWGETLPQLLLAETEEEFDQIYEKFLTKREELGIMIYLDACTEMMKESKEKLGIQ